ncbi:MAG: Ldh family oxidoreductase, partial [Alphaproteobacteria bacterium]|nr:Ldh family oxidoreductase [Alphaproteobacteria bacterium]
LKHRVARIKAEQLADTLVQADLWGHQSHGVLRTFWYADRFASGAALADAEPAVLQDAGAICVIDGRDGLGQWNAQFAMKEAIQRAAQHGVGIAAVRNSGHFGTAMYFSRLAALAGCIGIVTTNASPAMAPWGGREKRVGNNPWSVSAPAGKYPVFMFDMANTIVARGKLYLARNRGEKIPLGWAIDREGAVTDDPQAGILGNILPVGGHKGYGISLAMDVMSGVLTGSAFGSGVHGPYETSARSGVGHFMLELRIDAFRPLAEFMADMERMIAEVKATPLAKDVSEIFYPGEIEAREDARQRDQGIILPADTIAELNERAAQCGITRLLPV